ncbi:discoidin domain-containing protein, partial [Aestuariibaculum sediminum]
ISELQYLPDQSRGNVGIALDYKIMISKDRKKWKEVESGEFSNIRNNPIRQLITFKKNKKARYLKFTTKNIADGQSKLGIAEFDVF